MRNRTFGTLVGLVFMAVATAIAVMHAHKQDIRRWRDRTERSNIILFIVSIQIDRKGIKPD